ncbi:MAG TPA: endonuclease/exonuclease/phosphatase family protein [Hyphomicrobiaceae bacterium]|nr:endonuclease/exonuclease/phosphatase family protein [Hyphomicrobiaceae bacterium]
MSMSLRGRGLALACINIERSKHLCGVATFLRGHAPDVTCLQEVVADDVDLLGEQVGYPHRFFIPMCRFPEPSGARPTGIAILARQAFAAREDIRYAGGGSGQDVLDRSSEEARFRTNRYSVAAVAIAFDGLSFTIATTHFPWSDHARTLDFQRSACDRLLDLLNPRSLVLCGDFNAPRGKEIFSRLAARWADHIPRTYTTSLDPVLHRAGSLQLMVDGVFSTPDYDVSGVTLHQGVSDHCAITAQIGKRPTGEPH